MNCVFCDIITKKIPSQIVYENDNLLAFLDIKPINPGHTLVVTKEHHADILETPAHILSDLILASQKVGDAVMQAMKADGFNIGVNTKSAAGQAVFHTHFHIIPRFEKDGLKHWPHKKLTENQMEIACKDIKSRL